MKEYRFDRIRIHLSTKQGKRLLFIPWKMPPLTPKSFAIFLGTSVVTVILIVYTPLPFIVRWFIADVMAFPVTALFVFFSKAPTYLYHELLIFLAVQRLRAHKKMTVIGITGSYGKTSTKEILYTLLSSKYKTLKTEASKNSPIAIAEIVLQNLKPDHEVFIVEMGAYKPGEIARMSQMVRPEIGIVTAINAQHQDLFGSMETTMRAKYELIGGLVGRKIALFNADNEFVHRMSVWAEKDGYNVMCYSTDEKNTMKNIRYKVSDIKTVKDGISFTFAGNNVRKNVLVALIGKHQALNVLAAISAALSCGMSVSEAISACQHIHPFSRTMDLVKGPHGATLIDDTFNNNPDAAKAALNYLSEKHPKRIFVFQPMIELGQYTDESHEAIGKYAAKVTNEIILTNDNYFDPFLRGVQSVDRNKKVSVMDSVKAAAHLLQTLQEGDTVLFKGKEAARVLTLLIDEKRQPK